MKTLSRLKERTFLFVGKKEKNQLDIIIHNIQSYRHVALASNFRESKLYRKSIEELYSFITLAQLSLSFNDAYNRPYVYTGIQDRLQKVTSNISYSQPEAIFHMMNDFILYNRQLEALLEVLRN